MIDLGSIGLLSSVGGGVRRMDCVLLLILLFPTQGPWSHIDEMPKWDEVALTLLGHRSSTSTISMALEIALENEFAATLSDSASHADRLIDASGRSWTQTIPSGSRA